ncbi:hypothetical protein ACJIZ3_019662 [Penstemon smallii]|uniref:Uncharacterized protein n=1 Tax=Penstemon smallii TaxID=265156 RepID=A0ABD3T2S1_9LAMI
MAPVNTTLGIKEHETRAGRGKSVEVDASQLRVVVEDLVNIGTRVEGMGLDMEALEGRVREVREECKVATRGVEERLDRRTARLEEAVQAIQVGIRAMLDEMAEIRAEVAEVRAEVASVRDELRLDRGTLGSHGASNSSQGGGETDHEGGSPRKTRNEPVTAHLATITVMGSSGGHQGDGSLDTDMGIQGNSAGLSKLPNEGPEPSGKAVQLDRPGAAKDQSRRRVRRKRDLGAKRDSTGECLSSARGSRGERDSEGEWGSEVEQRLGVKRDSEGEIGLGGKQGLGHDPTIEDIDKAMPIECESLHRTFGASKPARRARRARRRRRHGASSLPGGKVAGRGPGVAKAATSGAGHTDLASRQIRQRGGASLKALVAKCRTDTCEKFKSVTTRSNGY